MALAAMRGADWYGIIGPKTHKCSPDRWIGGGDFGESSGVVDSSKEQTYDEDDFRAHQAVALFRLVRSFTQSG